MKLALSIFFSIITLYVPSSFGKNDLKVLLYSHIPTGNSSISFDTLTKKLKNEFEKKYPNLKVKITMGYKNDTYNVLNPAEIKSGMTSKDGFDLIEVDTLYLDKMVQRKLVQEMPIKIASDTFAQGTEAVTINGVVYGYPSFMCSYYLAHRKSHKNLDLFSKENTVSGMYSDSMVVSLLYFSFYNQLVDLENGNLLSLPNNKYVFSKMHEVVSKCKTKKCVGKEYFYSKDLSKSLTMEKHNLSISYSQILHYLEQNSPGEYRISPLKIGKKQVSSFYLNNAIVMNSKRCMDESCQKIAKLFIKYYTSLETQSWIALNKDNPTRPPRYTSPSLKSFYSIKEVKNNLNYQVIFKNLITSKTVHPKTLLSTRKSRVEEFIEYLGRKDKAYLKMNKLNLWTQEL